MKLWDLGVLKGVELPRTNTCKLGQRQAFEKNLIKELSNCLHSKQQNINTELI